MTNWWKAKRGAKGGTMTLDMFRKKYNDEPSFKIPSISPIYQAKLAGTVIAKNPRALVMDNTVGLPKGLSILQIGDERVVVLFKRNMKYPLIQEKRTGKLNRKLTKAK